MNKKKIVELLKKHKNLRVMKIGRGWIDVKSLNNGITMRWWNFMWKGLVKQYLIKSNQTY